MPKFNIYIKINIKFKNFRWTTNSMLGSKVNWEASVVTSAKVAIESGAVPTVGLINGRSVIHATKKLTHISWFVLKFCFYFFRYFRFYIKWNYKINLVVVRNIILTTQLVNNFFKHLEEKNQIKSFI